MQRFGKGESSLYDLRNTLQNSIIVSDDKTFGKILNEKNIEWITSADCLYLLYYAARINNRFALEKLEKLKMYIPKHKYEKIKNAIR